MNYRCKAKMILKMVEIQREDNNLSEGLSPGRLMEFKEDLNNKEQVPGQLGSGTPL